MAILQASHTTNVFTRVKIVRVKHLLDRLNSFRQETTNSAVLTLAILTKRTHPSSTLTYHMPKFIALVADRPLRTPFAIMLSRQAILATGLVDTGEVVMSHFLAPKASYVVFEVSKLLIVLLHL